MSSVIRPAPSSSERRPRRYGRWIAIAAISALIHLAAFDALPHWTIRADDGGANEAPLRATLMPAMRTPEATAIEPPQPAPTAVSPRPAKSAPTKPKAVPTARRAMPAVDRPEVPVLHVQADSASVSDAREATASSAPVAAAPSTAPPAAPPAPVQTAVAPPGAPAPQLDPPGSARLDYQVVSQNIKDSNPIYGKGTITWAYADGRYATDLTAAADVFLFRIDVLSSRSEGLVGRDGLEPDRYTESPRKRATVATNFNRDARRSVTFSASSVSAPLLPGTQDRLSVLFQIGALLLAEQRSGVATTALDIPVAGVRGDVEQWRFEARGMETIETGAGPLSTTHLQRTPRPGTNDRTIDVWVAQSDGGYPARVLYTEPNGSTVMMTLDRITPMR